MIHRKKVFKTKEQFENYIRENKFIPIVSNTMTALVEIKHLEEASEFCEKKLNLLLSGNVPPGELIRITFGSMDISGIEHPVVKQRIEEDSRNYTIMDIDNFKNIITEFSQNELLDEESYNIYSITPSQSLITRILISIKRNIDEEIKNKKEELRKMLNDIEYKGLMKMATKKTPMEQKTKKESIVC